MRSRVTILLMLVFGFAFSGAGTGLALQSLDPDTPPSEIQYGPAPTTDETPTTDTPDTPDTPAKPGTPTSPEQPAGGGVNPTEDEEPGEVLDEGETGGENAPAGGAPTGGGSAPAEDVQVVRQTGVQDTGDSLPVTGFAAIPVLLIGIALLVGGFVLRGSARKDAGA